MVTIFWTLKKIIFLIINWFIMILQRDSLTSASSLYSLLLYQSKMTTCQYWTRNKLVQEVVIILKQESALSSLSFTMQLLLLMVLSHIHLHLNLPFRKYSRSGYHANAMAFLNTKRCVVVWRRSPERKARLGVLLRADKDLASDPLL